MTKFYLHAEFRTHGALAEAIEALAANGVSKGEMEIYSRRPVETDPPLLPRRSRISMGAVLGAIAAGAGATALMFRTQLAYPLVTGGMPITSGWATAVVTFEATMAGAVLATALLMAWEAGLVPGRRSVPVPDLPDEGAVLQVGCSSGPEAEAVQDLLAQAGAIRVGVAELPSP